MKIKSIRVQKFRSVDDATLRFEQIIAIVGANNSGKSHFLRALNSFFNYEEEKVFFDNGDHKYNFQSRPKITVTFSDVIADSHILSSYCNGNELTIRATFRSDRKPTYEIINHSGNISIDQEKFKNIISSYKFVYIPISRDYKKTFAPHGGIVYSFLQQLFREHTSKRDTIQPYIERAYRKFKETILKNAEVKTRKYYPFGKENDFLLNIPTDNAFEHMIQGVSLLLKEQTTINDISNCGSGIQSAVYLAISLAVAVADNVNYLVGIEEPELNMHPQAQRKLLDALKDSRKYPNTQFIITTHSSVMIDKLGHQSIALCRKCKGPKRDIISKVTQLSEDFLERYNMQEMQYYNFFDFKNSDFFFSKYLIITESPIDSKVFTELLKNFNLDPEKHDITFLPANGEANIQYPYILARELKIPFLCIVDRDVFVAYTNNDRENSLDENGFPQYKKKLKKDTFWWNIFTDNERASLLSCLNKKSYSKLIALLAEKNIFSMRYSLEVDLIENLGLRDKFYNICDVPDEHRNTQYLFTQKKKMIKKIGTLLNVLHGISRKQLPFSYQKVLKAIKSLTEHEETY